MTFEQLHEIIRDNNNYMQAASGEEREDDAYVAIFCIPGNQFEGAIEGMTLYVKSERKNCTALYATHDWDTYRIEDLVPYGTTFANVFYFKPQDLLTYLPEILRDRKIICYDKKDSAVPLREMLASHGDRFELTSEVVDVKEEAREVLGVIPDYQLDTILAVCGYNPEDFAEDALGTVMKIRNIYESLRAIKNANV